jgi:hypothetical protein
MGIIDLEKIADRDAIERSRDLRHALKIGKLQLGRHSMVRTRVIPEVQVVERVQQQGVDENKLAEIVRQVVSEEMRRDRKPQTQPDIEGTVSKAVSNSVSSLMDEIRNRINAPTDRRREEALTNIDPKKFAELSQQSVDKISEEIETSGPTKSKKVQIINKNLKDLADEL